MSDIANKVETLMEAMPYLQKYQGKIIVIKYGGNAMINEELKDAVMHDVGRYFGRCGWCGGWKCRYWQTGGKKKYSF